MAFHKKKTNRVSCDSPEALFRDLRNRTAEGLLSHQADILRRYQNEAFGKPDVAIELPTGSGKTLVGLLIAEFRRITKRERVLYLCPNIQLVKQVVEHSERKYGIKATPFVGSAREYNPASKTKYQMGDTIAVAPYSALFNTKPFFDSPQLIILDDAHASENYIASNWSMLISRSEYKEIYLGLLGILKDVIPAPALRRFQADDNDYVDRHSVELIPTQRILTLLPTLTDFLDVQTATLQLKYPWSLLRDHVEACQVYVSFSGILVRPYIPPSFTHLPFAQATQRVFMSATLGRGGDLERITGVKSFCRLPIPDGWDKQGIGRRFFMFPELSLESNAVPDLVVRMIKKSGRALVLVPSEKSAESFQKLLQDEGISVFRARDIEDSKDAFIAKELAAVVLANRYDGIDFLGNDCRLLILNGLPKSSNLQELFLMSRLASGVLLEDRIRTRIIQAVGRCTRSATDYAAVCVIGEDFFDWLVLNEKRALFHPELQGELTFGVENSKDMPDNDFLENLAIFLAHDDDWDDIDNQILEYRDTTTQTSIPGEINLLEAVPHEVDYQYAIWNRDFVRCVEKSERISSILAGNEVKGLRGLWNYFGGLASYQAFLNCGEKLYRQKSADLYLRAVTCTPSLSWLRELAAENREDVVDAQADSDAEALLESSIDRIEMLIDSRFNNPRKFENAAREILNGLAGNDSKAFENAHVNLGTMLGFRSSNSNSNAAPDPWWVAGDRLCLVAEDKSDSQPENPVPVKHVRQAASHAKWIKENVSLREDARIFIVMITPEKTIAEAARVYADNVAWWHIDDFRAWARSAINVIRTLKTTFPGMGSQEWRDSAKKVLREAGLDPESIVKRACQKFLKELPVR